MSDERVIIRMEYPQTISGPDGEYQASDGVLHYLIRKSRLAGWLTAEDIKRATVYKLEEAQQIRTELVATGAFFDVSICLVGYESRRPGLTARITEWVRSLVGGAS